MLFIFKKKQIEIVALIPEERKDILELAPIKPANEMFPTWWKEIPSGYFDFEIFEPIRTVKNCPGIIGALTTGFILPLWTEIAVKYNEEKGDIAFADEKTKWYPTNITGLNNPEYYSNDIKIESPWYIKSPVNILQCDPVYQFNKPRHYKVNYTYEVPRNNYVRTDITLSYNKPEGNTAFIIKYNTPLLHFIPITDNKVKFRIETMNLKEQQKIESYTKYRSSFI